VFQDPNHPDLQQLAQHHDEGTHDQIPADQAAAALAAFQQNADPALVQQLIAQHYANMTPEQLQAAAAYLRTTRMSPKMLPSVALWWALGRSRRSRRVTTSRRADRKSYVACNKMRGQTKHQTVVHSARRFLS
jgi:hypothetical protein